MISIAQVRAARAMLHLSQKEVAERADISVATYNNIERGVQKNPQFNTVSAIQKTFEKEGIKFTNDPLGNIGIILKPKRADANNATILIVDDNKNDRTLYKKWLSQEPNKQYRVLEAENARDGFDAFIEHQPQCVILDFMMYGADGFQLLAAFKKEKMEIPPIIFVTGMHNEILEDSAKSQGVYAYLNKQHMIKEDLYNAVGNALRQS